MASRPQAGLRRVHYGRRILIDIEPLTAEYFATVAQWLSKSEINRWLTSEWRDRVIDPTLIAMAVRNKRNRFFLVRSGGEPCGVVALADWDPIDKIAMVWYVLGNPEAGSRGVTSTAVQALVDLAFQTLGIEALHAWIIEGNEPSRRVLEKNGFREAGRLRHAAVHNRRRVDRLYFDLIREDRST
jgi:RimJ/RimL family protein N-acetyltransferase